LIIGGGFSGATFALQAIRAISERLSITILEPRPQLGQGLAFSTQDPDHRLNAPASLHYAFPEGLDDFERWFVETGRLREDPEAAAAGGGHFPRRHEFAAYVDELLRPYQSDNGTYLRIRHLRHRAIDIRDAAKTLRVLLDNGAEVETDAVVLATGTRPARAPAPFIGAICDHRAFLQSPWDSVRLSDIDAHARILILGTALTTFDLIATFVRSGHRGPITAISRRGIRPQPRAKPTGVPPPSPWHRLIAPVPPFLSFSGEITVLKLLHALRGRIREVEEDGGTWHGPFDELRDALWQLWPKVSTSDKRRFMRHLRVWYDAHRFRSPPQTAHIVTEAEASGLVRFLAARGVTAEATRQGLRVGLRERGVKMVRSETFEAVINCTGIEAGPGDDPLSAALEMRGLARAHPSGFGWDVDAASRAIACSGFSHQRLFVIGAPSAGVFGDPIGSPFIVAQICRTIPAVRAVLAE
jgi:uncharacterized NAD(P)/FAD-binding protein YdhS